MWLLGLIIGAGFGAVFGHISEGALAGLALGWMLGRKPERDAPADTRWQDLETRIGQLERGQAALREQLRSLGVEPVETTAYPSPASAHGAEPARAEPIPAAPAIAAVASAPEPAPAVRSADSGIAPSPAAAPGRWAELENSPVWDRPAATEPDVLGEFWQRLISGNLLAKIGVALLFFGVASALKLAAEHGWFPPGLRLLLGGLAGGAMVGFGWTRREDEAHRTFGQILQGGGFGLLYLMVYFALAWYALIGHGFAFVLFALLGLGCTLLALIEEAPMLAVFGLAGAFLAPVLAASGGGSHVALFSYYLLLNGFILALAWFRDWRALTATGFVFTFLVGLAWALQSYRPEHYLSTQIFLILFFLLYSATPTVFALLRAPGRGAFDEALLIFGTPVAGILLQAPLVDDTRYGLAWSAFLAGLYYLVLWAAVGRREEPEFRLLRLTQFGIGLGFLTLAVPLAFGAAATVAIWAVEGAATLWLSLRLGRPFGQWFGLLAQFAAGLWLLAHGPELGGATAFNNGVFIGGLLVAAAGLVSAMLLRTGRPAASLPAAELLLAWGLAWWFGTGLHEIHDYGPAALRPALALALVAGTGLAAERLGSRLAWPRLRDTAALVLPAAILAVLAQLDGDAPILRGLMAAVLPAAGAVYFWSLWRREKEERSAGLLNPILHAGGAWLMVFVLTHDAVDRLETWLPGQSLWPALAMGLVPAGLLALADWGLRRGWWPFTTQNHYARHFVAPLGLLLSGWFVWTSFTEPGGGFARYLPLIDPLDLGLLAVLAAIATALRREPAARPRLLLGLVFVGLCGLAARLAHHYGGVPFEPWALLDSALTQALLSILWTLLSITLMIHGARAPSRERWFAGFGLLALVGGKLLLVDLIHSGTVTWTASLIGIALLVLAAAYFAPMPPKPGDGPNS